MLSTARQQKRQGTDAVVGVVETHGRKETGALLEWIECLPPKEAPYRGKALKGFDIGRIDAPPTAEKRPGAGTFRG